MSRFWSEVVHQLTPYVPGEQPQVDGLIKLNTNECPYGPSPKVLAAIKSEITDSLRLYPDPNADQLRDAIAEYFNRQQKTSLQRDNIFVGNGSDEVLAHTFHGLLNHQQPVLFPDISYSFYPVYCNLYQINSNPIPLRDDFSIGIEDYGQSNGGIIIANPNAPTGLLLSLADIRRLLADNTDSVVVIDEAYIDFGGDNAVALVAEFDNLLVVQTLSKSRNLAGLRVGFAIGHPQLIEGLQRVKNSFNSYPLSRMAIRGAAAAMEDDEFHRQTCNEVINNRQQMSVALSKLGFQVLPSAANFVFVHHPQHSAETLAAQLRQRKILVRYFKSPRIDNHLRISIGTEAECQALNEALAEILGKS